jgi:plasmid stability protein
MATLTIRRLEDKLVDRIKARARVAGHSMEEEVRSLLIRTYGVTDQLSRQRSWARRQRARLARDDMQTRGAVVDSARLIRDMREERDQQLLDALLSGHPPDAHR